MSTETEHESEVSGTDATIPDEIREALDIEDGDHLRWRVAEDGTLEVEVVRHRTGTFTDFEPFDGDRATDAATEHDSWGIE
jgi:bifunctional DNA-binding transcriptional regulator/antitoxin component of YhaV-PrlF toxin-antitoxin module